MNRRDALKTSSLILGYTITGGTAIAVLNGCKADTSDNLEPSFFTKDQINVLAEVCELIIPETDIAGAKTAKVHRFLDSLIATFPPEEREGFTAKVDLFDTRATSSVGKKFTECDQEEMKSVIDAILDENGEDKQVFDMIKEATVTGYCLSEEGATQLLKFDPVPGPHFQGCVDFAEVGGIWAL